MDICQILCVCPYFPFDIVGRMWDVIILLPDHCLSIYFIHELLVTVLVHWWVRKPSCRHINIMFQTIAEVNEEDLDPVKHV